MTNTMRFRDVEGTQSRDAIDYLEAHGAVVEKAYFSPNASMDGRGTLTVLYHIEPVPRRKHYLRKWRRWSFFR